MDNVTIYHNPRCSKSRQTLQLLQDNNIEPTIVEYLKNPPSKKELTDILSLLNLKPRELMRKKEAAYQENNLDDESLSNEQLIQAMIDNAVLIERPIVINNNKAAIGRPPENILEIL